MRRVSVATGIRNALSEDDVRDAQRQTRALQPFAARITQLANGRIRRVRRNIERRRVPHRVEMLGEIEPELGVRARDPANARPEVDREAGSEVEPAGIALPLEVRGEPDARADGGNHSAVA